MTPTIPELADKYLMHTAKRVPVTFVSSIARRRSAVTPIS